MSYKKYENIAPQILTTTLTVGLVTPLRHIRPLYVALPTSKKTHPLPYVAI